MKKIIVFSLIFYSTFLSAQATLEHSYVTNKWSYDHTNSFLTETGLKYYTVDDVSNVLKIFNSSHSLIKTVNIPVSPGFHINAIFAISDKLFNLDDTIEFIVVTQTLYEASVGLISKNTLLNDDGSILQEFGDRNDTYIIKDNNSNFKLITISSPFYAVPTTNDMVCDVYSLPGTTLNTIQNALPETQLISYPNPSSNRITIINSLATNQDGKIEVFDINGKKLFEQNISGAQNEIDVSNLSAGIYIYKINGKTNRFIKK